MSAEAALWRLMRDGGLPGKWTRIENRVGEGGTPDLQYCMRHGKRVLTGWVELKSLSEWPKNDSTIVKMEGFTKMQRRFHLAYASAGGSSYVLLRVLRPGRGTFMLMRGDVAAHRLGEETREGLAEVSLACWEGPWSREKFIEGLLAKQR